MTLDASKGKTHGTPENPNGNFGIPKMDDFFFSCPKDGLFFFFGGGGMIFDVNYGFCSEKNTAI